MAPGPPDSFWKSERSHSVLLRSRLLIYIYIYVYLWYREGERENAQLYLHVLPSGYLTYLWNIALLHMIYDSLAIKNIDDFPLLR